MNPQPDEHAQHAQDNLDTSLPVDEPDEPMAEVLRVRLVDQLWKNGALHNLAIDRAMRTVPRHRFLPQSPLEEAYTDAAIPTHWEYGAAVSSASQPSVVAIMLEQLRLAPSIHVLEIGAGTGYNAALLAELVGPGGSVATLDIAPEIAAEAREHLDAAGYPWVHVQAADGGAGLPEGAPYDRIILTASAVDIAPAWFAQLAEDGLLVMPLKLGSGQASVAFRKQAGMLASESLACCGFMRLRGIESSGEETVPLPDGRRLFGERASELREPVAHLLKTRSRLRLGRRLDSNLLQYLGLVGARLVLLLPGGFDGRSRRARYGVYVAGAEGPSLALFSNMWPVLHAYGSAAAEDLIEATDSSAFLPVEQWYVEARPHSTGDLLPVPPGTFRLSHPHFTFDIWPSGRDG